MAFHLRYTRRIRLMPGVRLNFSKSGISTSFGARGAWYTVQRGGRRRVTVGLPGTGLYLTKVSRTAPQASQASSAPRRRHHLWRWALWIFLALLALSTLKAFLASR